jgi:hypothetical protein
MTVDKDAYMLIYRRITSPTDDEEDAADNSQQEDPAPTAAPSESNTDRVMAQLTEEEKRNKSTFSNRVDIISRELDIPIERVREILEENGISIGGGAAAAAANRVVPPEEEEGAGEEEEAPSAASGSEEERESEPAPAQEAPKPKGNNPNGNNNGPSLRGVFGNNNADFANEEEEESPAPGPNNSARRAANKGTNKGVNKDAKTTTGTATAEGARQATTAAPPAAEPNLSGKGRGKTPSKAVLNQLNRAREGAEKAIQHYRNEIAKPTTSPKLKERYTRYMAKIERLVQMMNNSKKGLGPSNANTNKFVAEVLAEVEKNEQNNRREEAASRTRGGKKTKRTRTFKKLKRKAKNKTFRKNRK